MNTKGDYNIYRALHDDTGDIHYFLGRFREGVGKYVIERLSKPRYVEGDHYAKYLYFDTFAEAAQYRHYIKYGIVAQIALARYGYSRICPSGWDEKLGEGYSPWHSARHTRAVQ